MADRELEDFTAAERYILNVLLTRGRRAGFPGMTFSSLFGDEPEAPREDYSETKTVEDDVPALQEFSQRMALNNAKSSPTKNAFSALTQRQSQGKFSAPERSNLCSRYLPNKLKDRMHYHGRAFCCKFSPDGQIFCSASQDAVIHFYDTGSWKLIKEIRCNDIQWSIVDIDYSPDQRWIAYSSWSDYVQVVNCYGQNELHEAHDFRPSQDSQCCMFGIRFSPNSIYMLAGLNTGLIILYDMERKQPIVNFMGHDDDVNSVTWMDNSSQIFATGSDDGLVKVWDVRTIRQDEPECIGGFIGHEHGVTCVSAKGDGMYLVSNSKDQSLKLWDMRKMSETSEVRQAGDDPQLRIGDYRWVRFNRRRSSKRLKQDHSLMTYVGHSIEQTLIRCHFSPMHSTGQQYIYTGSGDGEVVIYNAVTGKVETKLATGDGITRDVSWHPYYSTIVAASWDASCPRFEYCEDSVPETDDSCKRTVSL